MNERIGHYRLRAIGLAVAFFLALAPTLPWQEFSSGPENLVVATAMEMRRGGPWLVPTLQGETRVAKPPLAAWITAAAIRPGTLGDIDTLDRNTRDLGFVFLAIETRWPALVCGSLLLLGVFELGMAIGGGALGLRAMGIAASSYFILRFARYTTTDIQLALWVTWANAFLAQAILNRRWWRGCLLAGMTLGLAMLSKGPVALVQSVLPFALFIALQNRSGSEPVRLRWMPVITGTLLFLIIGLWWYALVLAENAHVLGRWFSEVTRVGATETKPGPVLAYLAVIALVVPWTIFLLVGLVSIGGQIKRRLLSVDWLPLLLLVVPLAIMTLAKDRQDRYALPMIPAAAIVAAMGVREYLKLWQARAAMGRGLAALHWLLLGGIAIALPLLASTNAVAALTQADGTPWFTRQFAGIEAAVGGLLVLAGIIRHRTRAGSLVAMTVLTMLVMQAPIFKGYCASTPGRSDLKRLADLVTARYPGASYYNAHPRGKRPPTDLGVYLNRPIVWTSDPAAIKTGTDPALLFMLQNKQESEPFPPPGWNVVDKAQRDKDWWWAFVLPPR